MIRSGQPSPHPGVLALPQARRRPAVDDGVRPVTDFAEACSPRSSRRHGPGCGLSSGTDAVGASPDGAPADEQEAALRLYTPAQAAELLAVRKSWLRRRAGRRQVPCTFLGKQLRFSATDLQAIAAQGARGVRPPHPRRTR